MARKQPFTPNEKTFIQYVIAGNSYYRAYLFAYPKSRNWKYESVQNAASELARKPAIKKEIELRQAEVEETLNQLAAYTRSKGTAAVANLISAVSMDLEDAVMSAEEAKQHNKKLDKMDPLKIKEAGLKYKAVKPRVTQAISQTMIQATDLLNKMHNIYEKQETSSPVTVIFSGENEIVIEEPEQITEEDK